MTDIVVKTDESIKQQNDEKNNTNISTYETLFKTIDLTFITKYKKYINQFIEKYSLEYLELIRPTNVKKVQIDVHAKDQIMYILYTLNKVGYI